MSMLEELWRRVSATTPIPEASTLAVIAFAALALMILAWRLVRMAVTVCHEAGHAVAATLTGRSLRGIRLHSDTSGVTLTRGKPTGAGPLPVLELAVSWRRSTAGSDAAQLARLTRLPGPVWIVLWLGGTLGALAWGTTLMLPGLLSRLG